VVDGRGEGRSPGVRGVVVIGGRGAGGFGARWWRRGGGLVGGIGRGACARWKGWCLLEAFRAGGGGRVLARSGGTCWDLVEACAASERIGGIPGSDGSHSRGSAFEA
jgi:hypothetical protein